MFFLKRQGLFRISKAYYDTIRSDTKRKIKAFVILNGSLDFIYLFH